MFRKLLALFARKKPTTPAPPPAPLAPSAPPAPPAPVAAREPTTPKAPPPTPPAFRTPRPSGKTVVQESQGIVRRTSGSSVPSRQTSEVTSPDYGLLNTSRFDDPSPSSWSGNDDSSRCGSSDSSSGSSDSGSCNASGSD